MPNMFIEALTISDGKVHDETREIAVPPESRIAQIAIDPSQTIYKPGQKAKVKLKLTGPDGKPFLGSTVLAVYDKAVEYISGGSNVPEIKAFFWSWKRHHQPQTESSLDRSFQNFLKQYEIADAGTRRLRRSPNGIRGLWPYHVGKRRHGWACSLRGEARAMAGPGAESRDGAVSFLAKSEMPTAAAPAMALSEDSKREG